MQGDSCTRFLDTFGVETLYGTDSCPVDDTGDELLIEGLLTDRQAAYLLHVARSTVWRLMESGELPYVRFGRNRRIEREALSDFIVRHRACKASGDIALPLNELRR